MKTKFFAIFLSLCLTCTASLYASAAETSDDTAASSSTESGSSDEETESEDYSYSFSENTDGNAVLTADQYITTDDGSYQFIAVTTRSGDVFYVIIDLLKEENNVYFLNDVDTYDLQTLLGEDYADYVGTETSSDEDDEETMEDEDEAEEEAVEESEETTSGSSSSFYMILLVGILIVAGLGFAAFKLTKQKKSKNADFDMIDDEFIEEEEINEDEEKKS